MRYRPDDYPPEPTETGREIERVLNRLTDLEGKIDKIYYAMFPIVALMILVLWKVS